MELVSEKINDLVDKLVEHNIVSEGNEEEYVIQLFNSAIIANVLGSRLSYCHWDENFGDSKKFKILIRLLTDLGWLETVVESNFTTIAIVEKKLLTYIKPEEFFNFKLNFLVERKTLGLKAAIHDNISVLRMPADAGGTKRVKMVGNIVREGFRKSGNVPFWFDTVILNRYKSEFHAEITKGLQEIIKKDNTSTSRRNPVAKTDYRIITKEVIDKYIDKPNIYTLGENTSDARGRAIYEALKYIGNPISSKLFRSVIKIAPEPLYEENLVHVYRAIDGMLGVQSSSLDEKTKNGLLAYQHRVQVNDLWENIWLQRLYEALDNYSPDKVWSVPIELDVSSSMTTNLALLLNDHDMMKRCNLTEDETLYDPWYIEGVPRNIVKKVLTPMLYGSSDKIRTLMADESGFVDFDMVELIERELTCTREYEGKFYKFMQFRDFVLRKCVTQPEMNVVCGEETFKIACNRFKWDKADNLKIFTCWDSKLQSYFPISKEVKRTPDITTFNLFMLTLLLHNMDSQIANEVCMHIPCLPIHDAFIMHPNYVNKTKEVYLNKITKMYENRKETLDKFFLSIGITEAFPHNQCEEIKLSANSLR